MATKDNNKISWEEAIRIAATAYVEKEGARIIAEAKELNKANNGQMTEDEKIAYEKIMAFARKHFNEEDE